MTAALLAPSFRSRVSGAVVAGALLAAVCGGVVLFSGGHAGASQVSATLQNYAFNPPKLSISVGDTVTWTNLDDAQHTVTSKSGPAQVSSPNLNKGDKFSYTFTHAGTYQLYCAIHPEMTETVVVGGSTDSSHGSGGGGSSDGGSMPGMGPGGNSGSGGGGGGGGSGGGGGGGTSSSGSGSSAAGPSAPSHSPAPSCTREMLVNAMLDPFITHFDHAHLQEPPGQQVSQALNVDNYVAVHTVLFEDMLMPLITAAQNSMNGIDPFITHFDKAHLEQSPGQQVQALLNVDQYTRTHTVLFEDMLNPLTESVSGTYGC